MGPAAERSPVGVQERLHRAFSEFLAVPMCMVVGFMLLAVVTYLGDHSEAGWLAAARDLVQTRVFADARSTADLLGIVASAVITVTSITISLLLLALQQSAAAMTDNVLDQFLRRRLNQAYFGYFVGLAVFSLLTLATVSEQFNPVLGASLVFVLTVAALVLLLVLLYTTINQMRAEEIIAAIHGHTLAVRGRLLPFLAATRRSRRGVGSVVLQVCSESHGFVVAVDLAPMRAAALRAQGDVEIILLVAIGTFVAYGDPIAEVRAATAAAASEMAATTRRAVRLELQRNLEIDAAYGLEELEMIAWTSISTAKASPGPGLLAIRSLRDLLARWSLETTRAGAPATLPEIAKAADGGEAPVVYSDDTFPRLFDALESLAVASTESMQHQAFTEIVLALSMMFERLPRDLQARSEQVILRILTGMGDHMLTLRLETELAALASTLRRGGAQDTAAAVDAAWRALGQSLGTLNSRSTRVPARR
jgi:uncharacterized membrane protein